MTEDHHAKLHVRKTIEAEKLKQNHASVNIRHLPPENGTHLFTDDTEIESEIGHEERGVATESSERWWSQILGGVVGSSATFSVTLTSGLGTVMLGQLKSGGYNVQLTGREGQWLVSVYMLGMILGTSMSITILRRIGPARLMLLQTFPNLIMTLIQTIDYRATLLITSRFMAGLAIGTCSSCSIIFIGEVCAPKLRGALLMLPGFALALGYTVSYGLGSVMSWTHLAWVVAILPNMVMALGLLVLHESPVWLVNHSRQSDAEKSLHFYRGSTYPAALEVKKLMRSVECGRKEASFLGTIKLLRLQENLVPFLLVLVQTLGNVWSGQVAVFSYSVVIFRRLGSHLNEFHCSILLALIRLVVSLVAAVVIDRVGRRRLLLTSCMTAALGMAATGFFFYTEARSVPQSLTTIDAKNSKECSVHTANTPVSDSLSYSGQHQEASLNESVHSQASTMEGSDSDNSKSYSNARSRDSNESGLNPVSKITRRSLGNNDLPAKKTKDLSAANLHSYNLVEAVSHIPPIVDRKTYTPPVLLNDSESVETITEKTITNNRNNIVDTIGSANDSFQTDVQWSSNQISSFPEPEDVVYTVKRSSHQVAATSSRTKKSLNDCDQVTINKTNADSSGLEWMAVAGLCLAVAGVSLGIDPLTWALMGELLPAAVRDQAGAVATTVWGLAYFLVVQIFPDMNRLLGVDGTFLFFMACLIGNFLFVLLFLPETKGKSLLEIEDYFAKYKKKKSPTKLFA